MRRPDLIADCSNCAALCCVAPSFERSEDFAIDKAAGAHCPHERADHRCAIHAEREALGFAGCVVYECYGAGPNVTRRFADRVGDDAERNEVFLLLRVVHEWLWQLTEAAKLVTHAAPDVLAEVGRAISALDALAHASSGVVRDADLRPHESATRAALQQIARALAGERPEKRRLQLWMGTVVRER